MRWRALPSQYSSWEGAALWPPYTLWLWVVMVHRAPKPGPWDLSGPALQWHGSCLCVDSLVSRAEGHLSWNTAWQYLASALFELTAVYFANTLRKHLTFCLSLIKFMSLMKLMGEFLPLVNSVAQGTRQAFKKHKPREVVNEWVVRSLEKTLLLLWMHFSKMGRWDPTCELHTNTQPPCRCLFTLTHFLSCKSEARRGWFLIISWPVRWQSLSNWMIVYCSVTIATSNWAHVKLQASCLEKSIFFFKSHTRTLMGLVRARELSKSSALSQWRPLPNARSYPADCSGPEDSLVNLSCSHFPTVFTELGFLSGNKMVQIWVGCYGNCIRSLMLSIFHRWQLLCNEAPVGRGCLFITSWNHLLEKTKFTTKSQYGS